ncbi:bifunctional riboflavin kinase/FAD synthetase [Soehngenia saccharolytica]|nr:bifunctional riboflavin kinase/FAD synthetase [Soehngenia saccharolytica]
MNIIELNQDYYNTVETAIALGNFDGIHIGHQNLIKRMIEISKNNNLIPSVLIFENHTKSITSNTSPSLLSNNEQKLDILESIGVENVYLMKFNEEVMKLSPQEFINNILVDKLNCKSVVVGYNYKFGYKASGNTDTLKRICSENGMQAVIVNPIYYEDKIVSSTLIRNLITYGKIDIANKLLGRFYTIKGEVVHGKGIGTKLGFPTANIKLTDNFVIPKNGVYNTLTTIGDKTYKSATSVGFNPTFEEKSLKIENHIIGFNDSLYGDVIDISFIEYIRPEINFDKVDDLVNRMKEDVNYIKKKNVIYNF